MIFKNISFDVEKARKQLEIVCRLSLVAVIYKTFLFLFQVISGTEDAVCIGGWISGAYEDRLHVEVQTLQPE